MPPEYTWHKGKAWIPLESNPEVFTNLIHDLGVSQSLSFHDVLSLSDPDLLAFVPRPALALVLVFPPTPKFKEQRIKDESERTMYEGKGEEEDVIWFRQYIYNACGFYGLLHAVINGKARSYIR